MIRPGPLNLITDVDGLKVGNAQDLNVRSGVTVVVPDEGAVMAVDVRGGTPGTRETDALDPTCGVKLFDAITLSGGSAFGLDAAGAVMNWLVGQGRGYQIGPALIPVVPSAIIFDLLNGGDKDWGAAPPFPDLARAACENLSREFELGNIGAGTGATAGPLKGGLGSVSSIADDGVQVGALLVANPFGSVTMPGSDVLWAWPWEQDGEYGGRRPAGDLAPVDTDYQSPMRDVATGANTTLGVVATNVVLDKAEAQRIAIMAQDGISRAIRPVHTPFDGDTIFVISTGRIKMPETPDQMIMQLGMRAADCVARAIGRGVYAAEGLGDFPGYRQIIAGQ
jgi:L-aminopeptidase/D-esterase-like protein